MRVKHLPDNEVEHILNCRWKARTDLLWLCRNVLEYKLVDDNIHGPIQRHLQRFPMPTREVAAKHDIYTTGGKFRYTPWNDPYTALKGPRYRAIFDSRGWYKTTVNTIAHSIQWLLNYPHLAMMLLFASGQRSEDILKAIKEHFKTNPKMRDIFPDYCPQQRIVDWGTASDFILPNRARVLDELKLPPRVESSIMAQALNKGQIGYHVDIIKGSDLVEPSNVLTPAQRFQVKHQFGLAPKLLVNRPDGTSGWIDVEGTFYHPSDLHVDLINAWKEQQPDQRRWSIFIRGVYKRELGKVEPRYDPLEMDLPFAKDANGNRIPTWPEMDPLTKLVKEEADPLEGGPVFACTPGWANILMSNWRQKPIKDVAIGDEIVGFEQIQCDERKRHKLTKTKVIDKGSLKAEVLELTMVSGKKLYCTEDHLWFSGVPSGKININWYHTPQVGRKIIKVYDPPKIADTEEGRLRWAYLAGIIDGEGCISMYSDRSPGGTVSITQTNGKNRPILERIQRVIEALEIEHSVTTEEKDDTREDAVRIGFRGGRSMRVNLLANMDFAKDYQIMEQLWTLRGRVGDLDSKDRIKAIKPYSTETVYWLQTETGNYVSQGYASKNSQRLLDIRADASSNRPFQQGLMWKKAEDYRHVPIAYRVMACDLADTDTMTSNHSVIVVAAISRDGKTYIEDIQQGKWGPDTTVNKIFDTFFEYQKKGELRSVIIEDYAYTHGLKPTIDRKIYLESQARGLANLYLPLDFVTPDRTKKKVVRIVNALQSPYNDGELIIVEPFTCGGFQNDEAFEKARRALNDEFRDCTLFSTGSSDDLLDAIAYVFLRRQYYGQEVARGPRQEVIEAQQREQYRKAMRDLLYPESPEQADQNNFQTGW